MTGQLFPCISSVVLWTARSQLNASFATRPFESNSRHFVSWFVYLSPLFTYTSTHEITIHVASFKTIYGNAPDSHSDSFLFSRELSKASECVYLNLRLTAIHIHDKLLDEQPSYCLSAAQRHRERRGEKVKE